MSDYTPTTEEVRSDYKRLAGDNADLDAAKAEFDRWLAEVERAAAAKALTDAAEDYEGYLVEPRLPMEDQPSPMARHYKSAADRLRKRATALGLTAGQEGKNDEGQGIS